MQKITRQETLRMLEEAFAEDANTLTPETARETLNGWDSMGALMLIAELDSRFNIILTPEQSKAMTHVRDVISLLQTQGVLAD